MEESFTAARLGAERLREQLNSLGLRLLQIAETFERVDEEAVRDVGAIPWPFAGLLPPLRGLPYLLRRPDTGPIQWTSIAISAPGLFLALVIRDSVREVGQILRAGVNDSLADIAELDPSVWKDLGSEERLLVLQRVENTLAQTQGRPPVPVSIREIRDPAGGNTWGHYSPASRRVTIDRSDFEGDDIKHLVETVAHEGRHTYQHYAVDNPGFHPDDEDVKRWRHNFDEYLTAKEYGYRRYRTQPIETDAFGYGVAVREERYRD